MSAEQLSHSPLPLVTMGIALIPSEELTEVFIPGPSRLNHASTVNVDKPSFVGLPSIT
jgi:hypothetical protein